MKPETPEAAVDQAIADAAKTCGGFSLTNLTLAEAALYALAAESIIYDAAKPGCSVEMMKSYLQESDRYRVKVRNLCEGATEAYFSLMKWARDYLATPYPEIAGPE